MRALGARFIVAVLLGIAVVASLSLLASSEPDGFESSIAEAGHEPKPDNAPESRLPSGVLTPLGLVVTAGVTVIATRVYRTDAEDPVAVET